MTVTDEAPGAGPAPNTDAPLLAVDDLVVEFRTREGVAEAVNGVSFSLDERETLAILGESGCGKSVTAQAIMGILDTPPGYVTGGSVKFKGTELLTMSDKDRRQIRGRHIAMIFQDALSALNPVMPVGRQIGEMFTAHEKVGKKEARQKAIELMDLVRIPAASQRVDDYPHQFSGGMRQRIMIAMSLALKPDIVIADEPTTALDVTVQAQVMELLADLQDELNMGLILITHDLGVVADVADRIAVMYAGRVVEQAPVDDIYHRPAHPYTKGLLESVPRIDSKGEELYAIKGLPPNLLRLPSGCSFAPRCTYAQDICRGDPAPPLEDLTGERTVACHFYEQVLDGGVDDEQ